MPRPPRLFIEGAVYHVYNRVASGEDIFANPDTADLFLDLVREVKERDVWTIFAWCVMSNHYHLVVRTSAVPLARGMHSIQSRFGHRFNRMFGRTGGVWQNRYQAKLVEEGGYLARAIQYVHLNPVRAGRVDNLIEDTLCGHRELLRGARGALLDVDDTLLCFGESSRAARRAYSSAIKAGIAAIRKIPVAESSEFRSLQWSDGALERKAGQAHVDELGRSTGRLRPSLSPERYLEEVCLLLGADVARMAGRSKDRQTAELRRLVAALGVERWQQRCTGLAGVLGKNPDVVSYWVVEGVRRRIDDEAFAGLLDDVDRKLEERLGTEEAEWRADRVGSP